MVQARGHLLREPLSKLVAQPVRTHGGRGSSMGSPAARAPQQMDGTPVLAHGVRVNGSLKGREFVLG